MNPSPSTLRLVPALDHAKARAITAGARLLGLELPEAALILAIGVEVSPQLGPVVAHLVDGGYPGVAAAFLGVGVVAAEIRVPNRLAGVELEGVALPLLPCEDGEGVGRGWSRVELRLGGLVPGARNGMGRRARTLREDRMSTVSFMMSFGVGFWGIFL
jgi:hypothetical protein